MRVLHVTDTFLPKIGGTEITIDQLSRAMNELGIVSIVLAPNPRGFGRAGIGWREAERPYVVHRYTRPQSSIWAGWWIRRQIRDLEERHGPFDAVIAHHAFPPGYACVKYLAGRGRPVIVYTHGGDVYEGSRFRRKKIAWRKLGWALARSSAVVCGSATMERLVEKIIGQSIARQRIVRIANGVNLAEIRADAGESRFANDDRLSGPYFLGLGRVIRRKGFDLLVDAFGKLDTTVRRDWKLVIAGDGAAMTELQQHAASLKEAVVFTGPVNGVDKSWLLQNCRFMAAPSREEAFGIVALEAMACGKPVVASEASGFSEIVQNGINGELVDLKCPEALRESIAKFMAVDLNRFHGASHQTAQKFNWLAIAREWINLIEQLIARQKTLVEPHAPVKS